jgi:hypothetical protein
MHESLRDAGWKDLVGYGHVCPRCYNELTPEKMEELAKVKTSLAGMTVQEKAILSDLGNLVEKQHSQIADLRWALETALKMVDPPWNEVLDAYTLERFQSIRRLYTKDV